MQTCGSVQLQSVGSGTRCYVAFGATLCPPKNTDLSSRLRVPSISIRVLKKITHTGRKTAPESYFIFTTHHKNENIHNLGNKNIQGGSSDSMLINHFYPTSGGRNVDSSLWLPITLACTGAQMLTLRKTRDMKEKREEVTCQGFCSTCSQIPVWT